MRYNFSATRLLGSEKEAPDRDLILLHLPREVLEQMLDKVEDGEVVSIALEGRITNI